MEDSESAVPETDYEAQFVADLIDQFDSEPEQKPEVVDRAIEQGKEEEPEEEEPEEPEDQEEEPEDTDEEEGDSKISLRINGKKVDPTEILKHMTFTPKVDGEELEVDYDELISGYQRYGDYTRKQGELKKERDEIQPYAKMVAYAREDPKFMEHINAYFEHGSFAADINKNPLLGVRDDQLAKLLDRNSDDYDPERAADVARARSEWQKTAAERQQIEQRAQQRNMEMYNNWARGQIEQAQQRIDSLGGPGTYEKIGKQVLETYSNLGFNEQEIGGRTPISATDARFAELAYKASEFDRMMKENEAPKARLGKKRKTLTPPRSLTAGTGNRQPSSSKRSRAQYKRAVESQREDDWISVIADRMKL